MGTNLPSTTLTLPSPSYADFFPSDHTCSSAVGRELSVDQKATLGTEIARTQYLFACIKPRSKRSRKTGHEALEAFELFSLVAW